MNLTKTFPRSPKEKIAGLVHIPRMVDKARAFNGKTLGEYIFPCPLDKIILDFLKITAEEFALKVDEKLDLSFWIEEKSQEFEPKNKDEINCNILGRKPDTEEKIKEFVKLRNEIDVSRTDIQTWVDLIDLEEGRL